jgi:nitrate reductase beta subunit
MCVTACPYKKSYYNWSTGKSEKCILCYPRLEAGHAPACMHSCVGRIRYLGVVLYDADRIKEVADVEDERELAQRQISMILDPHAPGVIEAARKNGIADSTIEAAQRSPIYKFVREWGLALPLHPEFRTLPMLFYVPPLLPVMASLGAADDGQSDKISDKGKVWDESKLYNTTTEELWGSIDQVRFPMKYMANLFAAGDEEAIKVVVRKLMAVRIWRRHATVGDVTAERANDALTSAGLDSKTADAIYKLTALAKFDERFVIPPAHREQAIEMTDFAGDVKGSTGFGFKEQPVRGW